MQKKGMELLKFIFSSTFKACKAGETFDHVRQKSCSNLKKQLNLSQMISFGSVYFRRWAEIFSFETQAIDWLKDIHVCRII